MDRMPCLPVKITKKKYADLLQQGKVFMNSLYTYGSWSVMDGMQDKEKIKQGVQGDIGEGRVMIVDPKED